MALQCCWRRSVWPYVSLLFLSPAFSLVVVALLPLLSLHICVDDQSFQPRLSRPNYLSPLHRPIRRHTREEHTHAVKHKQRLPSPIHSFPPHFLAHSLLPFPYPLLAGGVEPDSADVLVGVRQRRLPLHRWYESFETSCSLVSSCRSSLLVICTS